MTSVENAFNDYESLNKEEYTGDVLSAVSGYVQMFRQYKEVIANKTAELKELQNFADFLDKRLIPALLFHAKVKKVELEDGSAVSYKENVYCSLPKEDLVARKKALDFIKEYEGGGIIKSQLIVDSPNESLVEELKGKFIFSRIEDVHPASLKSFMSELLGIKPNSVARLSLDEVPPELHLYLENRTTIKDNGKEKNHE